MPAGWPVHLVALFSLAVTLPVYQELGQAAHAPFLITHHSKEQDIALIILVFSFILPASLCFITWIVSRFSKALAQILFTVLFFTLALAFFLPVHEKLIGDSWQLAVGSSMVLSILLVIFYTRSQWAPPFLTLLAVSALAAPAWFYQSPSVQSLLASAPATAPTRKRDERPRPNIIMLVFDELPLISLLDENREIDAERFPNFARLADSATWYRNTTAVHYSTMLAMTALLIGGDTSQYTQQVFNGSPPPSGPVDRVRYPENLFSVFEPDYSISAIELVTRLAPEVRDNEHGLAPTLSERIPELFIDTAIVYAHVVMPDAGRTRLPSIEGQWRGFGREIPRQPTFQALPYRDSYKRISVINRFIASLEKPEQPTLFFLHSLLPHFPFEYDDAGRFHYSKFRFLDMRFREATGANSWPDQNAAELSYQAHLLQLAFTDLLLGRILDRLISTDLYEDSIVLLISDHGTSYYWDSQGIQSDEHKEIQAAGTAYVPFILKHPGQTRKRISDKPLQTTDVLPTLAELAQSRLTWSAGGLSALSNVSSERERLIQLPEKVSFHSLESGLNRSLRYKLDLFGARSQVGTLLNGPAPELQGVSVSEIPIRASDAELEIIGLEPFKSVDLSNDSYAAYLRGTLSGFEPIADASELLIAVAVNGVIRATGRTSDYDVSELPTRKDGEDWNYAEAGKSVKLPGEPPGRLNFMIYLPATILTETTNDIRVYGVEPGPGPGDFMLLEFNREGQSS